MTFADANRAQIRSLEEITWGTTPTTGSSREMRMTSSSLSANKETVVSDELRADRMVPDIVEVAASAGGEINFEWSSGPQDEFLGGFVLSQWTRPMTMDFWKGTQVSVSANNTFTLVGVDATPYLVVGRVIKTLGFNAAANNGYFTIQSVTLNGANTDVVVVGVTDLVVETGTNPTRLYDANDVIINGNLNIAATTAGFSGTGAFTTAVAAGQLQVGQQITVEGLGYGTATVTFTTSAAATFAMVLSDGINERTITTTTDFAPGADNVASAANFTAYLNSTARTAPNALNIKASHNGSGVVTITNLNTFSTDPVTLVRSETTGGGYAYESVADANVAVTSFATGVITIGGDVTTAVLTLTNGDGTTSVITAGGNWPTAGSGAALDASALATAVSALPNWHAEVNAAVVSIYPKLAGASVALTTADAQVTITTPVTYTGSVAPRGVFQITGVTNDLISVTPSPSTFSSGQPVVIKGSHLRNSGDVNAITQRSWSLETAYTDINQFQQQDGMVVGSFNLEVASGAILTGSMAFEGRATSMRSTTLLGTTPYIQQVAQPGEVSNATTDVGNITKDGSILNACIQSLSLSGEAGLRMQNCVGSKFPRGIGTGRFNLTGSATIYFENADLFNTFIQHQTLSLAWSVTDAEDVSYYFNIPAAKFSADEIAPGGIDQDVFENIEFTAFRDATTNTMFMVDRFSNDTAV